MIYAIIFILLIIIIGTLLILHLKKVSNTNSPMPDTSIKLPVYQDKEDAKEENLNPLFKVELINYSKYKSAIYKSYVNEALYFKTANDKRIDVYTEKRRLIGQIAKKDYKDFSLIAEKPEFFEGYIKSFNVYGYSSKKVDICLQIKKAHSKDVYLINNSYLNNLVTLQEIFTENQIIETNYGPATIIEIKDNHLIVEVPSLGKREIYDINSLIKQN